MISTNMKLKYRPEIDGLRAIAVMSVIFYHADFNFFTFNILAGGYLGVDIFFVISGYLITLIIYKELLTTNNFNIINFYQRRIRRIIPALLVVLTFTIIFGKIILFPIPFLELTKSICSSIFFYSNYFFYLIGLEYGGIEAQFKPLLHTWSLAVEEQFYIIFPILFFIIFKLNRKFLLVLLSLLFFLSFFSILKFNNFYNFNFYSFSSRMWEILAGSVLAYIKLNKKIENNKISKTLLTYVGSILVIYCLIFTGSHSEFNYFDYNLVLVVFGTCLIILCIEEKSLIYKILTNKILVFIGLISYSLYLWHYPIFAFSKITNFTEGSLIKKAIIFLLILLLSITSYFVIEKPFRNKNFFKFKIVVKYLVSMIILLLIPSIFTISSLNMKSRYTKNSGKHTLFLDNAYYNVERKNFIKSKYNLFKKNDKENILFIGNSYAEDLFIVSFMSDYIKRKYNMSYFTIDFEEKNCLKNFNENILSCSSFKDKEINNQNFHNSDLVVINFLPWSTVKEYMDVINKLIILNKKKEKKIILVSLRDAFKFKKRRYGFDKLDDFIYEFNRVPSKAELLLLEQFYWSKRDHSKHEINELLKILANKHNVYFYDITMDLCNKSKTSCKILTADNSKIYYDNVSHFTIDGAYFLSENILGQKFKYLFDKILND
jgi:peptidoglycan/LPS O-acetylase OafA/YrhL